MQINSTHNDIEITSQANQLDIMIKFKKSIFSSTIMMYYVVFAILSSTGLFLLFGSFQQVSSDDLFFLILWLSLLAIMIYLGYENIIWLNHGEEHIQLTHDTIKIEKTHPKNWLYSDDRNQNFEIELSDFKKIYFSEYIPYRNSIPGTKKGNLHIETTHQKISFAINLNSRECLEIIRAFEHHLKKTKESPHFNGNKS